MLARLRRATSAWSLALTIAFGCSPSTSQELALNSFLLKTLQGDTVDMEMYKGKTVFINVWATWCKPCIQEMPSIAAAMETLKDRKDIVFLFASSEEVEEISDFRERRPFPFEYVRLLNLEALQIKAIPATFIYNPSGEMIFGEEGFRNWNSPDNLKLITQTN